MTPISGGLSETGPGRISVLGPIQSIDASGRAHVGGQVAADVFTTLRDAARADCDPATMAAQRAALESMILHDGPLAIELDLLQLT